jgi:hypothetical protein
MNLELRIFFKEENILLLLTPSVGLGSTEQFRYLVIITFDVAGGAAL